MAEATPTVVRVVMADGIKAMAMVLSCFYNKCVSCIGFLFFNFEARLDVVLHKLFVN